MKQQKIAVYSETFGKRITKWHNIESVTNNVADNVNDAIFYENCMFFMLHIEGYEKHMKENLVIIFS